MSVEWSTVSNAADRSSPIRTDRDLLVVSCRVDAVEDFQQCSLRRVPGPVGGLVLAEVNEGEQLRPESRHTSLTETISPNSSSGEVVEPGSQYTDGEGNSDSTTMTFQQRLWAAMQQSSLAAAPTIPNASTVKDI